MTTIIDEIQQQINRLQQEIDEVRTYELNYVSRLDVNNTGTDAGLGQIIASADIKVKTTSSASNPTFTSENDGGTRTYMYTGRSGDATVSGCSVIQNSANNSIKLISTGGTVLNGDIYSTAWTDYSATSTIVGWSSFTTKKIYYKKIGRLVFFKFFLAGTSNSTAVSFTLPYNTNSDGLVGEGLISRAQDNSVNITTSCAWEITSNSNIVNCYKDHALGAWTIGNTKRVIGQGWYEATT